MFDSDVWESKGILVEDVVGAYGFNMLASCPGLGGQCFPGNLLPCVFTSPADMGWGWGTPLWYNPTSNNPCSFICGCCLGAPHRFSKDDTNWGSPDIALRASFEQELRGEGMARELAKAESESAFMQRFLLGCAPDLERQEKHLNDTWAKDVNERLLKPAGYYCVLYSWTLTSGGNRNDQGPSSSFLQLLIMKMRSGGAPSTKKMERSVGA